MIITELACALNIEFIIHKATSTMYSKTSALIILTPLKRSQPRTN